MVTNKKGKFFMNYTRHFVAGTAVFMTVLLFTGTLDQQVFAHNLQTKFVYMFFDPDTIDLLSDRMSGASWAPPEPLLKVGDELGMIIKLVPRDGTTTGVGGHLDFYVPDGITILDTAYIQQTDNDTTDGITGYDKIPMKGQSPIATGSGPVGAGSTTELIGLNTTYSDYINYLGINEDPVDEASGTHRGTISGVYGDTGIFYSTDPDTAHGSWQRFTGNAAEDDRCGVVGTFDLGNAKTITNNSGDVFVPCNKWDAGQMFAWGVRGTTCVSPGCQGSPIVDYGDGRGSTPWGFGSSVPGPESGYAWEFNWDSWRIGAMDAAGMQTAMANTNIGPWKRIQYPGSRISKDNPGSASIELGLTSVDASNIGYALSPSTPLPSTVSQSDGTSPNAIRWSVGQITDMVPEYAWVKFRVDNAALIANHQGCPVFYGDTFGGDAGGTDTGKDHLWRYYEPSRVIWNGCLGIGKPASETAVKTGDTYNYRVFSFNLSEIVQTGVVIEDTLPAGVNFISSFPAQSTGPNPLRWDVG
ncbi:MAG: hypothetical protein D3924_13835, partial [Candidatus Electrothrix sp. AR4]|nr:hypothetical protein [Candidatus Electrothrix sp. AR4]